jgi:hypothetical protein
MTEMLTCVMPVTRRGLRWRSLKTKDPQDWYRHRGQRRHADDDDDAPGGDAAPAGNGNQSVSAEWAWLPAFAGMNGPILTLRAGEGR